MAYNVIDDGNNELVKAAKKIIFDWKWSNGKSKSSKFAPVSKSSIRNARQTIDEVEYEYDALRLQKALAEVVLEAENNPAQNGLLVKRSSIEQLEKEVKSVEEA